MPRLIEPEEGHCVPEPYGCGQPLTGFRQPIHETEYGLSGMCQRCQDDFFGTQNG